jgi:hypothetical protein
VSKDRSSADGLARTLSVLTSEIEARIDDDTRLLSTSSPLDVLYRLKLAWEKFDVRLSVSAHELTQHSSSLEEQLVRLDQLNKTWQATLQSAKQPQTPPPLLQSVQSVVDSVERTQQPAESGRDHVLTRQSHLSGQEARVRRALWASSSSLMARIQIAHPFGKVGMGSLRMISRRIHFKTSTFGDEPIKVSSSQRPSKAAGDTSVESLPLIAVTSLTNCGVADHDRDGQALDALCKL